MTPDFLLGQLRLALVAFLSYAAGKGWLTPADADFIKTVSTALGPVAVIWAWSLYRNFDKKFVASDTITVQQISPSASAPNIGDHVSIGGAAIGKVVGALLAVLMGGVLMIGDARAADSPLAPLRQFAIGDLQAALDDALSHDDKMAADCYTALIPLVQSQQANAPAFKLGVFIALQKARDAARAVDMLRAGIGPVAEAKNKCAAIVLDANAFLLRLGALGAGKALIPLP